MAVGHAAPALAVDAGDATVSGHADDVVSVLGVGGEPSCVCDLVLARRGRDIERHLRNVADRRCDIERMTRISSGLGPRIAREEQEETREPHVEWMDHALSMSEEALRDGSDQSIATRLAFGDEGKVLAASGQPQRAVDMLAAMAEKCGDPSLLRDAHVIADEHGVTPPAALAVSRPWVYEPKSARAEGQRHQQIVATVQGPAAAPTLTEKTSSLHNQAKVQAARGDHASAARTMVNLIDHAKENGDRRLAGMAATRAIGELARVKSSPELDAAEKLASSASAAKPIDWQRLVGTPPGPKPTPVRAVIDARMEQYVRAVAGSSADGMLEAIAAEILKYAGLGSKIR